MNGKQRAALSHLLQKKLVFVMGKGGVGKTSLSQAFALSLARASKKTLWIGFEDPLKPLGEYQKIQENLTHLNCDPHQAFEEYVSMKIGIPAIARVFIRNTLMQYLSKAAPGVQDIVMMGKVWSEMKNNDHVIVDMPSTGYGLALFNSVQNYARLFRGSPVQKDAEKMIATFGDPTQCGSAIITLPEEMPITEAIELEEHLLKLFPNHLTSYIVNKRFPKVTSELDPNPEHWPSPVPTSATDYVQRRTLVETDNLKILSNDGISFSEFEWKTVVQDSPDTLSDQLAQEVGKTA